MIAKFRRKLDSITTYRVVLYGLCLLAAAALTLSAAGTFKYSSFGVLSLSLILLLAVCFGVNLILGKLYKIPINLESSLITALILFFVLAMPSNQAEWLGIGYAGIVAMASKFVLTWRGSNIYNPAALAVLVVSVLGIGNGSWWVADPVLFVPSVLLGVVIFIKLRRFELFWAFFVPALFLTVLRTASSEASIFTASWSALTLYPLVFLGTVMLTEPSTMPTAPGNRLAYGAIVGLLLGLQINIGPLPASPHLALLVGNLFALLVTPRPSYRLRLVTKTRISPTTYDFAFEPERPIRFRAGQYMDFTLPGVKLDARGNRRTFTIASSPFDKQIHISVKFYSPSSKFKERLASLQTGDTVLGNHVAGDFILPKELAKPIVFVAGGIGVTPFIAMIKDLITTDKKSPITLYYFAADKSELVHKDALKQGVRQGMVIIPRIGKDARLSNEDIKKHMDAQFYLSGPPGLVNTYKAQLKSMKVKKIHTDYFSGY